MDCPVDGTKLVMSERQGVEIDYCPDCRGVWLDRGELDKIVERSERAEPGDRRDEPRRPESSAQHPKKKRSFFSEIFEGLGGEGGD
jgi:Zn-finger nucleic acid-binding protein